MSTKTNLIQVLNETAPVKIASLPEVADRFRQLYITFNGKDAAKYYEAEKFHFQKLLQENAKLQDCTHLSLYGCFLDMAVNGLSFDPSMGHGYIIPVNAKVSYKDADGINRERWEKRAQLRISGKGELVLRMQQGQIKYADNPVLVFSHDDFVSGTRNDKVFVEHTAKYPVPDDATVIACYLKITRADDTIDYKVISMYEIQALRKFSEFPDSLGWTKGILGMVQAKTIKHAFRSYPKIRVLAMSKYTELESSTVDTEAETVKTDIYGLNGAASEPIDQEPAHLPEPQLNGKVEANATSGVSAHISEHEVMQDEDFDGPRATGAGITHEDDEDF